MGKSATAATAAAATKDSTASTSQERRARRKEIMAEKRATKRQGKTVAATPVAVEKMDVDESEKKPSDMDVDKPVAPVIKAPKGSSKPSSSSANQKKPPVKTKSSAAVPAPSSTRPPAHLQMQQEPHRQRRSTSRNKTSSAPRKTIRPLSTMQLKQVDAVFLDLFGYSFGTEFAWEDGGEETTLKEQPKTSGSASTRSLSPGARAVLCRVLGPSRAARMLRMKASGKALEARRHQTQLATASMSSAMSNASTTTTALKSSMPGIPASRGSNASSSNATAPSTVTSIPKQQSPLAPSAATAAPSASNSSVSGGGVDDLLKKMNETGKVSTIAKTAHDWEAFKEDNGLTASLEEHTESKGAFLKKKDFLERVDHRKFEHERTERERDRLKKK